METNLLSVSTQLSLHKAEMETLLALLHYPEGVTVVELSRELNLPRPTIYSHLETLLSEGFAKRGIKENTSLFYPASKDDIENIFEEKTRNLKKSKESLLASLNIPATNGRFKPKFFVYEGAHAYEHIWRDILWTQEETFWVWPLKSMLEKNVSSEKLKEFHEERIQRGIWMNVLWPEKTKLNIKKSPFLLSEKEDVSLRRVRVLPKGLEQDIGYGIYGNKVAFISSGSENYAFVIESKELARALKQQFDFFWKVSRKYV
jgi:sugar-specific transcriptional regulator TrmB